MTVLMVGTTRFCRGLCGSLTLFLTMPGFMMVLRLPRCWSTRHMYFRTSDRRRRRGGSFDLGLSVSSHVRIDRLRLRLVMWYSRYGTPACFYLRRCPAVRLWGGEDYWN